MSDKICTVEIGKNSLDNDYTFYSDGRVEHFYDRNQWKLNQTESLTINEISFDLRAILLEKCDPSDKEKLTAFFSANE